MTLDVPQAASDDSLSPSNREPHTMPFSSFAGFCFLSRDRRYQRLRHLSETLARKENWDYSTPKNEALPVLSRYINYTFKRVREQDRIAYSADLQWAAFNTGLVTDLYRQIFGLFERSKTPGREPWYFHTFVAENDSRMKHFATLPDRATYFDNPAAVVYDTSKRLVVSDHAIIDRVNRFPEHLRGDDQVTRDRRHRAFESAVDHAEFRVKQSYRAAVPQYYWPKDGNEPGRLQLLLPICLDTPAHVDVALAVDEDGPYSYRAYTVLETDWAYSNARLIAKPDSDWLQP